jgi:hypothetical protein
MCRRPAVTDLRRRHNPFIALFMQPFISEGIQRSLAARRQETHGWLLT